MLLLSAKGMLVEERLTLSLHLLSIGYDSPSHILITVTVSLVDGEGLARGILKQVAGVIFAGAEHRIKARPVATVIGYFDIARDLGFFLFHGIPLQSARLRPER